MENKTLGQKIEYYRKRAKMSQLDLELAIGAGQGSISRIENDQVNPTKETLSKIFNALRLKSFEIAELLGLEILTTDQLILAIQSFSTSFDLSTTLQAAVDILFGLFDGYNGGIIFLEDKEKKCLRARTISNDIPNLNKFLNLLPFKLDTIEVNLNRYKNLATETMRLKKPMQSFNLRDFSKGVVDETIANSIQVISGYKSGITIPMFDNEDTIGIVFITKNVKEEFDQTEIKLLELLSKQISIAILNARKYEEIRVELEKLKYGK